MQLSIGRQQNNALMIMLKNIPILVERWERAGHGVMVRINWLKTSGNRMENGVTLLNTVICPTLSGHAFKTTIAT
jgi:hypothetical protein